jgi:hypothetical protein
MITNQNDRKEGRSANRRLAKKLVQCLIETLFFVSSSVLADSLLLRNPLLRQAPKRYVQPYDDQHSYINRQKTKDKMPTLRKIKRGASLHTRQRFCTTFNFTQPHPKPTHHPTNANFAEWN